MDFEIFKTDGNRTYIAVDSILPKEYALTQANTHFCVKLDRLGIGTCWVKDDTLYFKKQTGAKKCWLIWRKTKAELAAEA